MSSKILKETRQWMQWNCHNGDTVIWGSEQVLLPHMTVNKLEVFAKRITHDLEAEIRKLKKEIKSLKEEK